MTLDEIREAVNRATETVTADRWKGIKTVYGGYKVVFSHKTFLLGKERIKQLLIRRYGPLPVELLEEVASSIRQRFVECMTNLEAANVAGRQLLCLLEEGKLREAKECAEDIKFLVGDYRPLSEPWFEVARMVNEYCKEVRKRRNAIERRRKT